MKDAHGKQGQYYLEYLKFSCDPTCDECEEEGWTGGIPITRSPLPALDPSSPGKFLPVDELRLAPSEVDSILPSVQVKKMFVEKKVTSFANQTIRQACLKLNIDESSSRRYLQHLEFLALKAGKRNLERNTIPEDICNLPSRRGWKRSNSGGGVQLYFKAYFANFRTPPPSR